MDNYKVLALIGGIFGVAVTPIVLFVVGAIGVFVEVFSGDDAAAEETAGTMWISVFVSIIISIAAIVIAFVSKNTKVVGIALICLGVIMVPATHIMGVVSWVLFIVGGVLAIRAKPAGVQPAGNAQPNPDPT